jgi:uncharacterized protein YjiS (DUF1127 family)
MSTIHFVRSHHTVPTKLNLSLLNRCWSALLDWQARARLRTRLSELSDAELQDMGITRGEIDYVARNRSEDPRSAVR